MNTAGDVTVAAHAGGDVLTVTATGAGAAVAAGAASVALIDLTDTTNAYIGNTAATDAAGAQVNAGGNVLVTADDETTAYLITGAVSIGATGGGIGASVSIAILNKNTNAYIGSHASINALGNSVALSGILDGNYAAPGGSSAFETLAAFHGVAVQSYTTENVNNFTATGAGGLFVGLAGAVSIELFNSNTQAYVGGSAHVNSNSNGANSAQSVDVAAANQASDFSFAGGLAAGAVGIAGGADVGLLKNSTQAYISNGATVAAQQNVDVYALADDSVQTYVAGFGGGLGALVGSVSVWSIGEPYSAGYTDGNQSDGTVQGVPSGQLNGSDSQAEGQGGAASSQIGAITNASKNGATGNTQYVGGTVSGAQSGAGGAITPGMISQMINSTQVPQGTVAFIGSGAQVTAGNNVNVQAQSEVSYTTFVGAVTVGAVAVGGSIAVANIEGNTQAYIDTNAKVSAGGTVTVNAVLAGDHASGTALAGSGGIVAVGAQVIDIQDSSTESATINSGASIPQAAQVNVTASATRSLDAEAIGGNFGLVAAGAGVAIANASGSTTAGVADGAQIGVQNGESVGGLSVSASSNDTTTANSYGVAAGYVGLTAVYAEADASPTVNASIGGADKVTGSVSDQATTSEQGTAHAFGITVSVAASLGAAVGIANASPTTRAEVNPGASIVAGQNITVTALNDIDGSGNPQPGGADTETVAGAGAILVGAAGSGASSTASPTVDAGAGSNATLNAGHSITLNAMSHAHAGSQAIGAGLGIVGVGISISSSTEGGTTEAHADSGANLEAGGNVSVEGNGIDDAQAKSVAAAGGIVAGDGGDATATINPSIIATTSGGGLISAPNTLTVSAGVTPNAAANVFGVSAGVLAVGASVASANASPQVSATLGGNGRHGQRRYRQRHRHLLRPERCQHRERLRSGLRRRARRRDRHVEHRQRLRLGHQRHRQPDQPVGHFAD